MTRLSSLVLLSAAALAFAAPALAKVSVQGGETLCKTEIQKQHADAKSVKVDKESTRAQGDTFSYLFKVKGADDATTKLVCKVDRTTDTVSAVTPVN
jgi:hypothetical protein